jgi:hypothetical protein
MRESPAGIDVVHSSFHAVGRYSRMGVGLKPRAAQRSGRDALARHEAIFLDSGPRSRRSPSNRVDGPPSRPGIAVSIA